jgi:hypothetical protein
MEFVSAESADEITALETARRLNVDLNRVYNLLRVGRIIGRKEGDEWRVSRASVEARLRARGQNRAAAI